MAGERADRRVPERERPAREEHAQAHPQPHGQLRGRRRPTEARYPSRCAASGRAPESARAPGPSTRTRRDRYWGRSAARGSGSGRRPRRSRLPVRLQLDRAHLGKAARGERHVQARAGDAAARAAEPHPRPVPAGAERGRPGGSTARKAESQESATPSDPPPAASRTGSGSFSSGRRVNSMATAWGQPRLVVRGGPGSGGPGAGRESYHRHGARAGKISPLCRPSPLTRRIRGSLWRNRALVLRSSSARWSDATAARSGDRVDVLQPGADARDLHAGVLGHVQLALGPGTGRAGGFRDHRFAA